jgi:cytochrome c nitrite reductase small subunit
LDTSQFLSRNALKLIILGFGAALAAMACAVGGYTMAESPRFCGSCHSMDYVYLTWQESNHKQFECTDCHLPNRNIVTKLIAKAESGSRDVYHETLRDYQPTIMVTQSGRAILADNCLRCHQSVVEDTGMAAGGQDCTKCHRTLVHGRNLSGGGVKLE